VLAMASTRPAACIGIAPAGHLLAQWDPQAFTLEIVQVDGG
jgi:hypothetical protein